MGALMILLTWIEALAARNGALVVWPEARIGDLMKFVL
jgi:hypothetical protein